MKCPFCPIAAFLCFAAVSGLTLLNSDLVGQDVTITIKKGDKETTIVKKSDTDDKQKQPFTGTRPSVDIAILLDTSNSMDGLIKQAKGQLWNIVQQFADAKRMARRQGCEYRFLNMAIRRCLPVKDTFDKWSN